MYSEICQKLCVLMCVLTWVDWHGLGETALLRRSRTPCEQKEEKRWTKMEAISSAVQVQVLRSADGVYVWRLRSLTGLIRVRLANNNKDSSAPHFQTSQTVLIAIGLPHRHLHSGSPSMNCVIRSPASRFTYWGRRFFRRKFIVTLPWLSPIWKHAIKTSTGAWIGKTVDGGISRCALNGKNINFRLCPSSTEPIVSWITIISPAQAQCAIGELSGESNLWEAPLERGGFAARAHMM